MGTLEGPNEGCGPNYESSRISKHGNPYTIYAFMNPMPQKRKTFDHIYMKELNTVITTCFMKF